jgi:tRNA(Ile2) C34 agmatinyltransferase TiaS
LIISTKLQSPEVDGDLQKEEEEENEDQIVKNIDQEIECPRCSDTMTLSSDFGKLGYLCRECDFLEPERSSDKNSRGVRPGISD